MNVRLPIAIALALAGAALLVPAASSSAQSVGTPAQIAWVRTASTNFVTAELHDSGSGACTMLISPMRATVRHRTCEQRWTARLAKMLRVHGMRRQLRAELAAIAHARVVVAGNWATISLPHPLIVGAPNRLQWTEECWMVTAG
jgi:hypothetical protein